MNSRGLSLHVTRSTLQLVRRSFRWLHAHPRTHWRSPLCRRPAPEQEDCFQEAQGTEVDDKQGPGSAFSGGVETGESIVKNDGPNVRSRTIEDHIHETDHWHLEHAQTKTGRVRPHKGEEQRPEDVDGNDQWQSNEQLDPV